jgi:ABC-2 type transport system ATP-binding protein/lipopolysaccharide transport system ATP-binding protein
MPPVIVAEGLGKRYLLGERADAYGTLRAALAGLRTGRGSRREQLWALRGVDLAVEEGEVLGVIGRNGAGKTTLLKLISKITEPTEGLVRMRGRVGALLEVGTGFHVELTGRENVFFNGAVLGMSRQEIERRFDDIVEFSGVERFLDTPVKRYSAGMYLRLAFSVAAHLEPEIVIVDEVLAVGDVEFRHRCVERMKTLRSDGRTVILVSHDLAAVRDLCTRCVLLEQGAVRADGAPDEIVDAYLAASVESFAPGTAPGPVMGGPVTIRNVSVMDDQGAIPPRCDRPLVVRMDLEVRTAIPGLDAGLYLLNQRGIRVISDALSDVSDAESVGSAGASRVTAVIEPVLPAGRYTLGAWIGTQAEDFFLGELAAFDVDSGEQGDGAGATTGALARVPFDWSLSRIEEAR